MGINLSFVKKGYFLKKLQEYLYQVVQTKKQVKGILLFGSLAKGKAIYSKEKISDIDLIIIFSEGELPNDPIERIKLQIKLMEFAELGIDDLWMTETEFKNMVRIKADIILYALDEWKILFDPEKLIKEQNDKFFNELKEKGVIKRKDYWIWPLKYLGEEIEW